MAKFHVNKRGNAAPCVAQAGNCPYGGPSAHYETAEKARKAYERSQADQVFRVRGYSEDPFMAQSLELVSALHSRAENEKARSVYGELKLALEASDWGKVHRLTQANAYRAELAHEFGQDEDAQIHYNAFIAIFEAEDARNRAILAQEAAAVQLERGYEAAAERHLADLEKVPQKFEELKERILKGEEKFSLWTILEVETAGRVYQLKEINSTAPQVKELVTSADKAYLGKLSESSADELHRELEARATSLLEALEYEYESEDELPAMESGDVQPGPLASDPSFHLIAGGSEVNVYLHQDSGMVYKVRHSMGLRDMLRGEDKSEAAVSRVAVVKLQESYESLELTRLEEMNASYLKTYFVEAENSRGEAVGITVQPYLDPKRFARYDPHPEEARYLHKLGFNDSHSGNMSMDLETGKVLLFDCIYIGQV